MKYLLGSKKYGEMAVFEYGKNLLLKSLVIQGDLDMIQIYFILSKSTTKGSMYDLLKEIRKNDPSAYLEEIPEDLSFERFWEEYSHKVGKKDRVRKKWESMPDAEKAKALQHIKKYNYFLSERPHMERKYPETYLNTAEWNN